MRVATATFVMLAPLVVAKPATGCSYSYIPVPVRSTFSVAVVDREQPVADMTVTISAEKDIEQTLLTGVTDRNGTVNFQGLQPGSYYVSVERAGLGSTALVVVDSSKEGTEELRLTWPEGQVVRTHALSGVLHGSFANKSDSRVYNIAFPVYAPLRAARLTALDAKNGRRVWDGLTDGNGTFAAPQLSVGLYVLHVEESEFTDPKAWTKLEATSPSRSVTTCPWEPWTWS